MRPELNNCQFELAARERKMAIWIIPISEPILDGKVTWTWEIEILPYTRIGQFYIAKQASNPEPGQGGNIKYAYKEWPTYEEAKDDALMKTQELYLYFVESTK